MARGRRRELSNLRADRPQPAHYGQLDTMIKWVDASKKPTDNKDRVKKLGNFFATFGALVCEFKEPENRVIIATGADDNGTERSHSPPEPDNWVYRIHRDKKDRVWAVRLIADHENKHDQKEHRSTQIISQCPNQGENWGWLADVLSVKKLNTPVSGSELNYNDAGLLRQLCEKGIATGKGKRKRGVVCFSINKLAGFVTDERRIGQWWHIVTLSPSGGEVTSETGTAPGCGGISRFQTTLRGDVIFDCEGKLAPLAITDEQFAVTTGDEYTGHLWIHKPVPLPPGTELQKDSLSNHEELPRKFDNGLWVYIRKEPKWDIPVDGTRVLNPAFPGRPTGTLTPFLATNGLTEVVRFEADGDPIGQSGFMFIPETLTPGRGMNVQINFMTPVGGFTSTVEIQLDVVVIKKGGSGTPTVLTKTATRTINSTTHPGSQAEQRLLFFLEGDKFEDAAGGKIHFALYRRADRDGNADDFDVVGKGCYYGRRQAE